MTKGKLFAIICFSVLTGMFIVWAVGYSMFLVGRVVRDAEIVAFKIGLEEKIPQDFMGFKFLPYSDNQNVRVIKPKHGKVKLAKRGRSAGQ